MTGCRILTNGYYEMSHNTVTTVEKVNKTTVTVYVTKMYYDHSTKTLKTMPYKILRRPDQVIVIDQQLEHNQKHYPEYQV